MTSNHHVPSEPNSAARGWSIRVRLLLIATAIAVPMSLLVAGIIVSLAIHERAERRHTLMYSARLIMRAVDVELSRYIAVVQVLEKSPSLQRGDIAEFRQEAERAVSGLPDAWVGLHDARGRLLLNTLVPAGAALPSVDPEVAAEVNRAFETNRVSVSNVMTVPTTRPPRIRVDVPVFRGDTPAYFLAVVVDVKAFRDLLNTQALPRGWIAGILDHSGRFVARSLRHERHVGQPATAGWRDIIHRDGIFERTSLEGERVTVANVASPLSGWTVGVASGQEAFESPIRRTILVAGTVGAAVLLVSLALAAWIARTMTAPIKLLAAGADALEHLRPVALAPTAVPEFDHAMRAFGSASTALLKEMAERRRAEAALRTFIDEAPAAIAMFDRDMRYVAASRRWIEDYRLDAAAIIGRSHYAVFPDLPERWKEAHRRALAGETLEGEADCFDQAAGGPIWHDWEIRPWYASDGTIGGAVLFTENVTERKRAEDALRTFVAEAPAAIAMFDRDMRYLAASKRWLEEYRLEADAVIGRSHFDVFPYIPERLKDVHRRALAGEVIKAEADRLDRPDAGPTWVRAEIRPWYALDGTIGGVILFTEDITARRQAEERMRDLQAELMHAARLAAAGEVAASLVHELGQPLTSIGNYIEAAQSFLHQGGRDATTRADASLTAARASTTRAADVLRSLRHFLRREAAREPWERIDVGEMVRQAVDFGLAGAPSAGLEVRTSIAPGLPPVVGNRIHLQQAIANLVRNAAEAMAGSPRRELSIRVTAGSDLIEIAISDTGPGFAAAPSEGEDPFHPFVTTKPAGMGLGLPLARRVAEDHRGRLWAEPNPGGGTILTFVMPIADEPT